MAVDIYLQGKQAKQKHDALLSESGLSESLHEDQKKIDERFDEAQRLADKAEKTRSKFVAALGRYNDAFPRLPFDADDPSRFASLLTIVILCAAAAFVLDYFWLGLSTSFILSLGAINPESLFGELAKIVIPLAVIVLEMSVATLLFTAFRNNKYKLRGAALFWGTVAVAFLGYICFNTASALIADNEADSILGMEVWEIFLIIAYTGLSSIPHVVLLFAGRAGYEGKALFSVLIRWWKAQRLNLRYDRRASAALTEYNRMERDIHHFEEKHQCPYKRGVFSKTARHIINSCAGAELIPPPPGEPYGDDGTPEPIVAPPSPRTAFRESRRNGESR